MKKILLFVSITLSTLIILGGSAWAYIAFFTAEEVPLVKTGVYADIPDRELDLPQTAFPFSTTTEARASTRTLAQLSARRVAGAVSLLRDGASYVRFAEQGTGHLYEVNIENPNEERISNTTFPKTTTAVWSATGNRVALTYETNDGPETYVGTIEKNDSGVPALQGDILPKGSRDIAFGGSGGTLYYAISTDVQTIGYSQNLKTKKETVLFIVPLSAVTVVWEPDILIVTKATHTLPGYAYRKDLSRVAGGSTGFFAFPGAEGSIITTSAGKDGIPTSDVLTKNTTMRLAKSALPDKCAVSGKTTLLCAVPRVFSGEFPDSWYRGEITYEDQFYILHTDTGEATLLVDPEKESGRNSDVVSLRMSPDNSHAIYINKTDSTLWVVFLNKKDGVTSSQ